MTDGGALLESWYDHLLAEWSLPAVGQDAVVRAALPPEHLAQIWELRWPEPRTVVRFAAGSPPRPLGPDDGRAVDILLGACTPEDREEAEVALDHDPAVGAFTDGRLVAMATVFEWHGFRDVGVLTSPDARGRGAGRAAVGGVVRVLHSVDDPDPVLYRHAAGNLASSRLAEGLGFPVVAGVCSVRTTGVGRRHPSTGAATTRARP